VHDTNTWLDVFGLKGKGTGGYRDKVKLDGTPYAKPGPKPKGTGDHNKIIGDWADEIESGGGTVSHGGNRKPEIEIETPNGRKATRRPDIIWKDKNGKVHWGNVGKTGVRGKPVPREIEALQDLNAVRKLEGVDGRVEFRSYNHPEQNVKKHH
jgi:hypothetical protein